MAKSHDDSVVSCLSQSTPSEDFHHLCLVFGCASSTTRKLTQKTAGVLGEHCDSP